MKILLFANTDWYLYNFRRSLAIALREEGHNVILVSPEGPYGEKLRELGFRWIPAPMNRRSLNPVRELRLILWLRRLLSCEKIDLIHNFTIKCAVYGSLASRFSRSQARVNAVAGMGYVFTSENFKARTLRPIVRILMFVALGGKRTRLILQNPDDVHLFEQAKLAKPANIRLIPGSGVDCQKFSPPLSKPARSVRTMRVLLPARLLWDKGLAEFIEAAKELLQSGREIEFLIAGTPDPGNPAAVPETTVRQWEKDGLLQWLGHVDDMPELFHSVDVVALPSYREGLPKGLIEAGACGLALITTDVPGCREVVQHRKNGLLVPAKNGQALAQAIAELHDDVALRHAIGTAARQTALDEFDEKIIIKQTLAVYQEFTPVR